jgi:hypothetical protein
VFSFFRLASSDGALSSGCGDLMYTNSIMYYNILFFSAQAEIVIFQPFSPPFASFFTSRPFMQARTCRRFAEKTV